MHTDAFWDSSDIRSRLDRLASHAPAGQVFGANGHGFRLFGVLGGDQLARFERERRFVVPPEYAIFLTEVGDGGAGPGYGLFPLGMCDGVGGELQPWSLELVGDLSRDFPHDTAWNLPAAELQPELEVTDDQLEAWIRQHDRAYFAPSLMDGAIPIAHMGCAIQLYLVVAGPLAGQVWTDDRASDGGIYPCEPVTFGEWYLQWLDACERTAGGTR